MVVSIEFFGRQRQVTQTHSIKMPITGETKLNDALAYVRNLFPALHLDDGAILVTVNHEMASLDRVLMANETVSFLPFIGGG
ncbi:MAG: MoaD/ThiS family protein [Chloroflexi bacterium]|nr:MoaD/ThiS family protein [Chloroflexota bacterium]MBM3183664.1 MoaD/ThiS family protein [Chloroflexota bacterium]MBM4453699.1 MoaD/ThiS family protein [Chloroflexota bacterium]